MMVDTPTPADFAAFEDLLLRYGIEFGDSPQDRADLGDFYAMMQSFFAKPAE
jgi:hypothetical protein